jgi:hypothetical protein
MGLSQTSRILRREFRRMYIDTSAFNMMTTDMQRFIDIFGSEEMAQQVGHVLTVLKQTSLPAQDIDILSMIRYLQQLTNKFDGKDAKEDELDVLNIPIRLCREDFQYVTSINLSQRDSDPNDPSTMNLFQLCILVEPSGNSKMDCRRRQEVRDQIVWRSGFQYSSQVVLDIQCGAARMAGFTADWLV